MAPGGRLPGWHPARESHHGPELKRSIREAEDTGAVDLSLNSKIKYQDAEKNLREKDMGQLRLLDRRSPDTASSVLRGCPPPLPARLVPRGLPVESPSPVGLPVLRPISSFTHAVATTPAVFPRCFAHPIRETSAFPESQLGRLPHCPFRWPAQRSLTLRPARSPSRPWRPSTPEAAVISLPPSPLRLLPAGATVARVGFAPTEDRRLFIGVAATPTRSLTPQSGSGPCCRWSCIARPVVLHACGQQSVPVKVKYVITLFIGLSRVQPGPAFLRHEQFLDVQRGIDHDRRSCIRRPDAPDNGVRRSLLESSVVGSAPDQNCTSFSRR